MSPPTAVVPQREREEPLVSVVPTSPPEVDWDAEVRAHNRRVVVSVMALGFAIDVAEDIAQQAWMRLMEQNERGRFSEIKLPGLAIAQARFLALSKRRSHGKQSSRLIPVDDMVRPLPTAEPRADERLVERERLERAVAELGQCSDKAQRVFRMLYDDPRPTHKEIAAEIGVSVQRVRQIVWEVRTRLRTKLEEKP
jgi:RNA polymerase sigma-70 factor (ECF subfamily)